MWSISNSQTRQQCKGWHVRLYRLGVRLADAIVVQTEEQVPMCEATFHRRAHLIKADPQ